MLVISFLASIDLEISSKRSMTWRENKKAWYNLIPIRSRSKSRILSHLTAAICEKLSTTSELSAQKSKHDGTFDLSPCPTPFCTTSISWLVLYLFSHRHRLHRVDFAIQIRNRILCSARVRVPICIEIKITCFWEGGLGTGRGGTEWNGGNGKAGVKRTR